MKIHFVRRIYNTGEIITHYKTMCGILRHITYDSFISGDKSKVTCKSCLKSK